MADETQHEAEPKRRRVVALKRPPPPVNADAVRMCEELLRMAQAGELVELIAVWATADGGTDNERTAIEAVQSILGELRLVGDDLSEAARCEE